jgi:hypothetical protein
MKPNPLNLLMDSLTGKMQIKLQTSAAVTESNSVDTV